MPRRTAADTSSTPLKRSGTLRELDLHYVRQIARNSKEHDLERKIELEIKMREGTSRLLAAARHPSQTLEAARALLTSNERMSSYTAELQNRKRIAGAGGGGGVALKSLNESRGGKLSVSDLRFPLMWRDSDHFKNRGDYRRFAVFCLARIGTEIHDTGLLCPVDREQTDISFPDILIFNNVSADFELTIDVYSHVLQEDLSIASTPRRIRRSIHSSITRTVGKKLAASLRDDLDRGKGPQFDLAARATITLNDTDNNTRTHDLRVNNLENKSQALPLFGHFCGRVAVQPDCIGKEIRAGSLTFDGRASSWGRLRNFRLDIYESREHAAKDEEPSYEISVNKETVVTFVGSSQNELRITNRTNGSVELSNILRFDTSEEAKKWFDQLTIQIDEHSRWKHAADSFQRVLCVENTRNSFVNNRRQGSLYDETPLIESLTVDSEPTEEAAEGGSSTDSRNQDCETGRSLLDATSFVRYTRSTSSGVRRKLTGIPGKTDCGRLFVSSNQ